MIQQKCDAAGVLVEHASGEVEAKQPDALADLEKESTALYVTDPHSATTPGTLADRVARERPDKRPGYLLIEAAALEAT